MFTQRLNDALELLKLTSNWELAKTAGFDPSFTSRLRMGSRTPTKDSATARQLIATLLDRAEELRLQQDLAALCACEGTERDTLEKGLTAWLYEGWQPPQRSGRPVRSGPARPYSAKTFSERFSSLMGLAGLTNAHLAKLTNVDASLISRYRRGLRRPERNNRIIEILSTVLLDRVCAQAGPEALCLLIGAGELPEREEGITLLQEWLLSEKKDESGLIDEFLSDLENYDPHNVVLPDPRTVVDPAILAENLSAYHGQEGLQRAVLRFLGMVMSREGGELCLYSDQDMGWMTDDPDYSLGWKSLMLGCIRGGVHIRIVHTVDRGLKELLDAIRSWMPLYFSGQVEGFYHTRPRGARFTHTLFLAPELACVSCFYPAGREQEGALYRFETGKEQLLAGEQLFHSLLVDARPLFQLRPPEEENNKVSLYQPPAYPGVEILLGERSVTIRNRESPHLSFTVSHPLMREAFAAYVESGGAE